MKDWPLGRVARRPRLATWSRWLQVKHKQCAPLQAAERDKHVEPKVTWQHVHSMWWRGCMGMFVLNAGGPMCAMELPPGAGAGMPSLSGHKPSGGWLLKTRWCC